VQSVISVQCNRYRGITRGKGAGAWGWLLTSI